MITPTHERHGHHTARIHTTPAQHYNTTYAYNFQPRNKSVLHFRILQTVPNTLQKPNHFAGRSNTQSCKWTLTSSPNNTWHQRPMLSTQQKLHHTKALNDLTDIITNSIPPRVVPGCTTTSNSSTSEGEYTIHLGQSNIAKWHLQNQTGTPTENKIKHTSARHHGRS